MTVGGPGAEPPPDGDDPLARPQRAEDAPARAGSLGNWLAGLLVVALLAGAAYFLLRNPWNAGPADRPAAEAPAPPLVPPPASPDPAEIAEAYGEVRRTYAADGAAGVVRDLRACFQSLQARPSKLDFCLAYDMYAAAIHQESGADERSLESIWFSVADRRRAGAVRQTVGLHADPQARIAEVARLMREAAGAGPAAGSSGDAAESTGGRAPAAKAARPAPARPARPPPPRPEDLSVEGLY